MALTSSEINSYAQAPTMEYAGVRLEQLSLGHAEDLSEVVTAGQLDGIWYTSIPSAQEMAGDINKRLALQEAGAMAPFAIIDLSTGKAVGATTYLNIDEPNKRIEIGSTYLSPSVHGTGINPAKQSSCCCGGLLTSWIAIRWRSARTGTMTLLGQPLPA
ncbi:GNAT family N-acetyltransferase [Glutamicibacter halophytocola]|uniref:GNAT family N-acetyltransferase n=1 Tax=Glutamicibacter halophytocola TaxID=1933880 RepID=UPI003219A66D